MTSNEQRIIAPQKAQALLDGTTEGSWRADDEHGLMKGTRPAWVVSRTDARGAFLGDLAYIPQDMAHETVGPTEQPDAELMAAAPDLARTVATEPGRTRAAVVKALRDGAGRARVRADRLRADASVQSIVANTFDLEANAIENGADL